MSYHQPGQQQRQRMLYKITVLGDGGVGKTALTVQFTMASFVETYDPTIEDCYRKQWSVDGQPCLLEVLDTAGQEEYTALRDQWIRDGEGFLVVYSVASRDTFNRVDSIVRRVRRVKEEAMALYGSSNFGASPTSAMSGYSGTSVVSSSSASIIPIVIIGNKRDINPNRREVSAEEGQMLARRCGCDFFETSAKDGYNVENAFKTVVRGIKVAKGGPAVSAGGAGAAGSAGMGGQGPRRKDRKSKKCVIL